MVAAVQAASSANPVSLIFSQAAEESRLGRLAQAAQEAAAQAQLVLSSTALVLSESVTSQLTYNASGTLDAGPSDWGTTAAAQAGVVATDAASNALSVQQATALEASTIAENSAILDEALADSLAEQRIGNDRAIATRLAATAAILVSSRANPDAAADRIDTLRQIEITRQAAATLGAGALDELLSGKPGQTTVASQDGVTNIAAVTALPVLVPTLQVVTPAPGAARITPPTVTENVVAASTAPTNDLAAVSEIAVALPANPVTDSTASAIAPLGQSTAGVDVVTEIYPSVAPAPLPAVAVTVPPPRLEDTSPAVAVAAITAPTQAVVPNSKISGIATDGAATLPLIKSLPRPVTEDTNPAAAATAGVVAKSAAVTNSQGGIPAAMATPRIIPLMDSAAQALSTVALDPAYANLVAGKYAGMAASSAHSPSVAVAPMRLEEIKAVIAIPAITALGSLDAQSGRDGNPSSGYRQRSPAFNTRQRPAANAT